MHIHMQVSFVELLWVPIALVVCTVFQCVDNTSDNNMYLLKNAEFVLSDNLNKMRSWK